MTFSIALTLLRVSSLRENAFVPHSNFWTQGRCKATAILALECGSRRLVSTVVVAHLCFAQVSLLPAWRDFYTHVLAAFPRVSMGLPFKEKYGDVQWESNPEHLEAWTTGRTGVPIVDAGIRQANTMGVLPKLSTSHQEDLT